MEARFEMGEVLLSARIFEVSSQFLVRIVTRYLALANQVSKLQPGSSSEFGRLSKGQYALGIESDGKLNPKTRLHLRHGQPQAASNGFGYVKMQRHGCFLSLLADFTKNRAKPRMILSAKNYTHWRSGIIFHL